jgi:hypothetical protein
MHRAKGELRAMHRAKGELRAMHRAKGEFHATLRAAFGVRSSLGSEQVALYTSIELVMHNSPSEGGSRGMFFLLAAKLIDG